MQLTSQTSNSGSDDFRLLIQREFVERCRKNPRYSLRAFAKSLALEPSPLSAIMRGKRPVTAKMKKRIGLALGLNLEELANFSHGKPSPPFQQIALDAYAVIADWYHYAILELIKVDGFEGSVEYIAKALSINNQEAHIAIERLERLGLLKKNGNRWIDKSEAGNLSNINGDLTSQASRKLQKQILELSLRAIEELPVQVRNHTSMTMAINPEDLPEAKKRIQTFRRELCSFFESNKKPTQVYHLGISLYPVSHTKENL